MRKIMSLLFSMLKTGLIGFGGGNALIPVIEQTVVEEKKLITQSEYEEDIVVASITPGALPVELAAGIGKRVWGSRGMILAAVCMAFPGVLLTLLMTSVMSQASENMLLQIQYIAVGITAFIMCLLTEYIKGTFQKRESKDSVGQILVIMLIVFALTCGKNLYRLLGIECTPFFSLSTIHIFVMSFFIIFYTNCKITIRNVLCSLLLCVLYILCVGKMQLIQNSIAAFGIKTVMLVLSLYGLRNNFKDGFRIDKDRIKSTGKDLVSFAAVVTITLIAALFVTNKSLYYVGNGFLSSIMSFGGGDAYLTVADGLFVNKALITEDEFYSCLVPIVNILPGSILCKTLSGIGYYIGFNETGSMLGGYVTALSGFACSVAASCGVFSLVGVVYGSFEEINIFQMMKRWIRPIVSGLMLTVMLSLLYQNYKLGLVVGKGYLPMVYMLIIYMVDSFFVYGVKMENSKIVLLSAVMAFIFCNLT